MQIKYTNIYTGIVAKILGWAKLGSQLFVWEKHAGYDILYTIAFLTQKMSLTTVNPVLLNPL